MLKIRAGIDVASKGAVDQNLPHNCRRQFGIRPYGMGQRRTEIGPGAIAHQDNAFAIGCNHPSERRPGVFEHGRVLVLWRQAIVDRNHAVAGLRADFGADIIVTVEITHNKATTMTKQHRATGITRRINSHRHIRHPAVFAGHQIGARCQKFPRHIIVNPALLFNAKRNSVLGITFPGLADEGPGFFVD